MDRTVNAPSRIGAALLALACLPLAAQTLQDPTRPPTAQMLAPGEMAELAPGAPQLQSILISRNPGGRRVAVISGQTVRVGGKVGDAVLYRINAGEVVLRRGKALETLRLFPVKTSATPAQR
ncbi:MSHA biogenesis protein MshK [Janthinobacterium sp.]|uniref:MSHA biogenesis protein MshK n=1 Tax=Janthinobacterium sp. TaxID=1871054 RepID=UPI00293D9524|nr:MSHA biogenesis protein MshK [Janthinobacterium sp.]